MKSKKMIGCIFAGIMLFPLFGVGSKSYSARSSDFPDHIIVDEDIISKCKKKLQKTDSFSHTPLYTGAEYAAAVGMGRPIKVQINTPQKKSNDIIQAAPKPEENSQMQETAVRYKLTDEERSLIEHIVMSESGNTEPYEGQALIAQCLLDACEIDNISPFEAARLYQYAAGTQEPNESVKTAVSNVFDKGELVTPEPVVFYYNPRLTQSRWHESQEFVIEVGRHRFFKKRQ